MRSNNWRIGVFYSSCPRRRGGHPVYSVTNILDSCLRMNGGLYSFSFYRPQERRPGCPEIPANNLSHIHQNPQFKNTSAARDFLKTDILQPSLIFLIGTRPFPRLRKEKVALSGQQARWLFIWVSPLALRFRRDRRQVSACLALPFPNISFETKFDKCGSRPPAREGHRGLCPGGNVECGRMESLRFVSLITWRLGYI